MPDSITKPSTGRPLRIIYADDLQQLRELMHMVLTREGHSLDTFENGRLALDRLSLDPLAYDLLITDHHMPEMNGMELVEHVRRLRFPGKILVFSSELSQDVDAAYLALHVDRVLPKPVLPTVLRQVLIELFTTVPVAGHG
jgi:CheY-like chemotaxis protein